MTVVITLGFEMMSVRTPAMAGKTLAMIRIAYNLMRALVQRAAHEAASRSAASVSRRRWN